MTYYTIDYRHYDHNTGTEEDIVTIPNVDGLDKATSKARSLSKRKKFRELGTSVYIYKSIDPSGQTVFTNGRVDYIEGVMV